MPHIQTHTNPKLPKKKNQVILSDLFRLRHPRGKNDNILVKKCFALFSSFIFSLKVTVINFLKLLNEVVTSKKGGSC